VPACDVPRRLACRRECDDGPRATLDRVGIVQDHDHHESELRCHDDRGDDHDVAGQRERRFERERNWHDHDDRADHDELERTRDHGTAEHRRIHDGAADHAADHGGDHAADHRGDHAATNGSADQSDHSDHGTAAGGTGRTRDPVAAPRTRLLISP
jgi:hypothetical protein